MPIKKNGKPNSKENVIIVKSSKEIKDFIYNWLCSEIGKSNMPSNYLKLFSDVLSNVGLKGKVRLSNLKDFEFDAVIDRKKYKMRLRSGCDSLNSIQITYCNITKTYDWCNKDPINFKLFSICTKLENFELITYYSEYFTTYYINTHKAQAEINLYEQERSSEDDCPIIAPKAKIFEEKILSSKCKTTVEDILYLIFEVYGKEVVIMSKEISIAIKEKSFKAREEKKEEKLVEEIKLWKGNIISIFKDYGNESVDVDILSDNFVFCNKDNKFVFHKKAEQVMLYGDDSNIQDYAIKQVESIISEYTEMLKKF